jgi:hypothetical protein
MIVDRNDETRSKFGELEGLSADTAPQVKYRWKFPQFAAKTKGSGSARAVAGTLTGQVLVNFEKYIPEARAEFSHGCSRKRRRLE